MPEDFNSFLDAKIAEESAPAPEAPAAEPTTEVTPEASPVVETAGETPAETEPDSFDRKYVEELRKESAKYRERAKTWEGAFEGIAAEDQEVFKALAKTYASDPAAAIAEMRRIAEAFGGEQPDPDGEPEVMTVEKYNQIKQQEALQAQAQAIATEAKGLGYNPGTPEYQYLLAVAKTLPDLDLSKAHAHIKGQTQAAIDAAFAAKAAQAEGSPVAPSDAYAVPSSENPIKTFKDAREAFDQMIAAQKSS